MSFTLHADEAFSLAAAAGFARNFPGTRTDPGDGLRFAWALDDDWRTVAVSLRQEGRDVLGEIEGEHDRGVTMRARRDVERILGIDVDGSGFVALGEHDPVVRRAQALNPGLRPVLFYTPYEAAAWTIIGQRIQMGQAAVVKRRLADELGERGAFPAPARLVSLDGPQRGLTERKVEQLRGLAEAARQGLLGREHLRAMSREDATSELQELAGIGPFSAELIWIRGVGDPDALPISERRLAAIVREVYHLAPDAGIEEVSEGWRPFRSWVSLLLRFAHEDL